MMWTIILVAIAVMAIAIYNKLITLKNRVEEAWSDIEVQLKRRYDLIPNFVETVKGYASHEKDTLERVIQARNAAMSATGAAKGGAENTLSGALKSVFALAESYPDLKASENFKQLQLELSDTENKIQASRRFFNSNVRDYNTSLQTFPSNIFASIMGFKVRGFFEIEEQEKKNPEVKF